MWLPRLVMMGLTTLVFSCSGAEYEVIGRITQTITGRNGSAIRTTNEFTVFVRNCSWLIQTLETDKKGHAWQREVGSSDGTEIYEANGNQAFIRGNGVPVELLDRGVDGHLWLMLASQCYWSGLHTDRLTPIFDWHASVGANPDLKLAAEWELLNGPGSLPREVQYLGRWGETNALYRVTGTTKAGETLLPSGFVFEEYEVGPLATNGFVHEMAVRKRVEAEVTSVQAFCSKKDLLPALGKAMVAVDWRLKEPSSGNHVPTYMLPNTEKWPSVQEAKTLVADQQIQQQRILSGYWGPKPSFKRRIIVLTLMCILLVAPPLIYLTRQMFKKAQNKAIPRKSATNEPAQRKENI